MYWNFNNVKLSLNALIHIKLHLHHLREIRCIAENLHILNILNNKINQIWTQINSRKVFKNQRKLIEIISILY